MALTAPQRLARVTAVVLFTVLTYLALAAIVFAGSWVLLQRGITPSFPWITAVQEQVYFAGARRIWVAQEACVEFDEQLIYRPRIGTCRFDNPEFHTTQTFDADGRNTGPKPQGPGIAVLGDSYAMGWGVNDEDTFPAVLQRLSGRPVYNLGVASYGTARELIRLERNGLPDRVDTVIIQYCENDLEENRNFSPASAEETRAKYSSIGQTAAGRARFFGSLDFVGAGYWFTLNAPISLVKNAARTMPPPSFRNHYDAFISVLRRSEALRSKRVFVFYTNGHGMLFSDFPSGRDSQLPYVEFVQPALERADFYQVDDHLIPAGHAKVARHLNAVIAR
jgi:hypothetical protein